MTVSFRNVDVADDAPVVEWPYEAIVTVIERGTVRDWARLTREIGAQPWGSVARQVEQYLQYEHPWGVGPLLQRRIERARRDREAAERAAVAAEVHALVDGSGLTIAEFAARLGTSRPRLSTYRSGRVTPSAALLVRMRRLAEEMAGSASDPASTGAAPPP